LLLLVGFLVYFFFFFFFFPLSLFGTSSKFGTVFEKISYNEKIPVKQLGFDKSVIEIDRDDLEAFMRCIDRYMRQTSVRFG